MSSQLDERQLLMNMGNDDREAFNELYRRHMSNVYNYVHLMCKSKEVTEEVVQDLFVKVWLNRYHLYKVQFFKSYIFRCAQNLLLDQIRKQQLESRTIEKVKLSEAEDSEKSDSTLICKEFRKHTKDAIDKLPEKRKRIVELRTHDELSLDEIAEQLSISKSVVKKQLYSGLHFVREYLHKVDNIG